MDFKNINTPLNRENIIVLDRERVEKLSDEIINSLQIEKTDKQECVKIMDKLEELTERLEEKSEIFFDDEKYCTKENLQKLLNLYKQQEDFFDSAIKKADN